MAKKECGEMTVYITIYFCRERDERICRTLPVTDEYYSWRTFEVDLAKYGDIEEIVDHILNALKESYRRTRARPDTAERWAEKIRPYILETVVDVVSNYISDLMKSIEECRYDEQPSGISPIYSTAYPSMFSELETEPEVRECEKILKCSEEWLKTASRYVRIEYGALQYVLSKLPPDLYNVVAYINAFLSPHERVLMRYGLKKYFYEVYYHD
ncbi:MAG: hypothetical protein QXR31_01510 [Zestosphaera sp.]